MSCFIYRFFFSDKRGHRRKIVTRRRVSISERVTCFVRSKKKKKNYSVFAKHSVYVYTVLYQHHGVHRHFMGSSQIIYRTPYTTLSIFCLSKSLSQRGVVMTVPPRTFSRPTADVIVVYII